MIPSINAHLQIVICNI